MKNCKFCELENNIFNTKLFESKYFFAVPTLGALVPNYILIITKRHINAMSELSLKEFDDYKEFLDYLINIFKTKFNSYPIIFEHGCPDIEKIGVNSVSHSHTHLLNFKFKDNEKLIEELKFNKFDFSTLTKIKDNYIYFRDENGNDYISFEFEKISQLMRIKIAEDLNIQHCFNWKEHSFIENVEETINNFKTN